MKSKFSHGELNNFKKETYQEKIFPEVVKQFFQPLFMAAYKLEKEEVACRDIVRDALYAVEPDGPDAVRSLMERLQDLQSGNPIKQLAAMQESLGLLSEDEAARVTACWPELGDE